uniref:HD-GYP domain-containing protein n=1 Tax=Meloidogyne hapla TaxID=6305 RepID=A0A1I8BMR1_MELHA
MAEIVAAMYDLGIQFSNPNLTADINAIRRHIDSGREYCSLPLIVSEAIKNLWRDPAVRVAYERRGDYHIQDSAS